MPGGMLVARTQTVDVGARLNKDVENFDTVVEYRGAEGGAMGSRLDLDIGPPVNQQLDHRQVSVYNSLLQRSASNRIHGIRIRAAVNQKFHTFFIFGLDGGYQRRRAGGWVYIGAMVDQQLDHVVALLISRDVDRPMLRVF